MPKSDNQKLKTLYILDILTQYTDAEHGVTMPEIIKKLEDLGVSAERKSIYNDIFLLREYYGADIETVRTGGGTEYRLMSRTFELPELKLLVDAVEASKFITRKKSDQLVSKLRTLAGKHASELLKGQVVVADRIKTMNESIYYNVDAVNEAIHTGKQLAFLYFEWLPDGSKRLRRDGAEYVVNPCTLCWDDENYYLIAVEDGILKHYRVDKMQSIRILDKPVVRSEAYDNFDAASYSKTVFGMYGGIEQMLTLRCTQSLVGAVFDRFGHLPLRKNEDGFEFTVKLRVSPQFFGWLSGFAGDISIVSPQSVKDEYVEYLNGILLKNK
jgi:predicted DNA-binding transcriptional regulator YafY